MGHLVLLGQCSQGKYDKLGMWLDGGDKEYMHNFGMEISWKTSGS